jgi:putative CocE/NonD family hydrolase
MRTRHATILAFLALVVLPAAAHADPVPPGAVWTQATIPSSGGVQLHADILRPKAAGNARTPVILSIGPYFNHSGQTGPAGPAEDTGYDPVGPSSGPSGRFYDFVNGAHLMDRGYTYVMVDLRGFGGSSGCLDWAGPGEQADVVNAVKWAAGQPWSTGSVGMYGKSYDAVTGLIGVDHQPPGLKAVVAQEPVYDLYRYLYGDGMRRENSLATPALYDAIALTPGPAADVSTYNADGATTPDCLATNWLAQASDDNHDSDFWKARNLIPGAQGSDVPLFLTQGLTENNTVSDGTAQYLDAHTGPERAWMGPWDHVRGNETCAGPNDHAYPDPTGVLYGDPNCPAGQLKEGRHGFFDEVMRFYDQYLKGVQPSVEDPPIAVQTNDGKWRAEESWPPVDSSDYTSALKPGTYNDGDNSATSGSGADYGVWTISPPLPYDAHLSGSGQVSLDVTSTAPNANLVVVVYDLDPSGTGPVITRQGHLIRQDGKVTLDLWSADWKLAAGHRIGVKVADADDWWVQPPSGGDVTIKSGTITLPFLAYRRTKTIEGDPGVQLKTYLKDTVTVTPDELKQGESGSFALPPALQTPEPVYPSGPNTPEVLAPPRVAASSKRAARVLRVSGHPSLRRALRSGFVVLVRAKAGHRATVRAWQGRHPVGGGSAKADRHGVAHVRVRFTKAGRHRLARARTARLTLVSGTDRLSLVLRR